MTHTKSELVDLDAGWEEPAPEPALTPVVPSSTPPDLGDIDEGWGETPINREPRATAAQRPVGSDATKSTAGRDRLSLTKRERRELERRQRITRAQRQAARKQAKKQARQQAARRRNEERGEATIEAEPERSAPVKRHHPKSTARHARSDFVTETTKADASRVDRSRRPPTETSLRSRGPSVPAENASRKMSKPRTRFVSMLPYLAGLVLAAALLAWVLLR